MTVLSFESNARNEQQQKKKRFGVDQRSEPSYSIKDVMQSERVLRIMDCFGKFSAEG